jgi:death on curing protein
LPSEPHWLPVEVVIEINRREVAASRRGPEPFLLLDPGGLESAVMKPRNLWHYGHEENTVALASAMLFDIARKHPFIQGNKRTGFTAAVVFLASNGYELIAPDTRRFGRIIKRVLLGKESEQHFIDVLTAYGVRPIKD